MKKSILVIFIILLCGLFFPEEIKIVTYSLSPRNMVYPGVIQELIFNGNGLLIEKRNYGLEYDGMEVKDIIFTLEDLYKWEIKKDNIPFKSSEEYEYDFNSLTVTLYQVENNIRKIGMQYKIVDGNIWAKSPIDKDFELSRDSIISYSKNNFKSGYLNVSIVDDILMKMDGDIDTKPNKTYIQYGIEFDGKNVYTVTEPDYLNEGFKFLEKMYVYIPKHITFSKETALLNSLAVFSYTGIPFVTLPTIKKESIVYMNNSITISKTPNQISITKRGTVKEIVNYTLKEENGMSLIYDEKKVLQGLLLTNSDFALFYEAGKNLPEILSEENSMKISPPASISASSFLKEKNLEYKAENLSRVELALPWVEGVKGQGIGEKIQFNKNSASGMYLINGYISMERPDLYKKNSRVQEVIIRDVKKSMEKRVQLFDTAKPQYIDLEDFKNVEMLEIEIVAVYPGSLYEDTCIAGLVLVKDK